MPAIPAEPAAPAGAPRVLIVEDEPGLARTLAIALRARGYQVASSAAGRDALAQAALRPPDLVLLDLGLPDLDGTEVIARLRDGSAVPVIVLSGRSGQRDKIGALDAGADDYLTKPFAMAELLARLRALLRREQRPAPAAPVTIGRCTIDLAARTASRAAGPDGPAEEVRLTRTEWAVLEVLAGSPGQLVPAARLTARLRGPGAGTPAGTGYLRFHLAGLRRKLEDDPSRPAHLLTEPGLGYRFQP